MKIDFRENAATSTLRPVTLSENACARKVLRVAFYTFAERGLRRSESRNRHAKRRTGHVIERNLVAKRNRGGIAAVLAANAEFWIFVRLAASAGEVIE